MVKSLPGLLSELADSPYALMKPPQLWKIHPLIVQDPFMYTHVRFFSIGAIIKLRAACTESRTVRFKSDRRRARAQRPGCIQKDKRGGSTARDTWT